MTTDTNTLFFLTHPGTSLFSGYGLSLHGHRRDMLVGLLMVDRPMPVSPLWLEEIVPRYGEYELYPITETGERGIACQMYVEYDSISLVQAIVSPISDEIAQAVTCLLHKLPKPQLRLSWDNENGVWVSSFYQERTDNLRLKAPPHLFPMGQIVATTGALDAIEEAAQNPSEFLLRHVTGDWGDMPREDVLENERSLAYGSRLMSSYRTRQGVKIWVITEWDRSVTTLLLPSEY